jgi:hypothetical protein
MNKRSLYIVIGFLAIIIFAGCNLLNGGSNPVIDITTAPDIKVEISSVSVNSGGDFAMGTVSMNVPETIVLRIKNQGNAALRLAGTDSIKVTGDHSFFFIINDALPSIIDINETVTVTISFASTISISTIDATILIKSNDAEDSDFIINVTGSVSITSESDISPPTPGNNGTITVGTVHASSVQLSWTGAEDDTSAAADLQYKVVYSESDNIDTAVTAENNGTDSGSWEQNITTKTVSGLTPETTYYFNVLVKDISQKVGVYSTAQTTTSAASSDVTAPTVESVTPADSAIGVAVNTNITATFSEDVAGTLTTATFTLYAGSTPVTGAVSYDSGSFTATFNPDSDLASGTSYTAAIKTGVTDLAGNPIGSEYSWSFSTLTGGTDTEDHTGSILINSGSDYTNSQTVNLTLTAADTGGSGVAQMIIAESDSSFGSVSWETYSAAKFFNISSGDGAKTIYVQFKDGAGNESPVYNESITLDTIRPTGDISINNDDAYTNTAAVTLTLTDNDTGSGAADVLISEVSDFSDVDWDVDWQSYSATKPFNLSAGDGSKTVYIVLRDGAGNVTLGYYQDSITLDTTPPEVESIVSSAGTITATSPIPYTVILSEPVTGFDNTGIQVTGGTVLIPTFTDNGDNSYSFSVTPSADPSTVTVSVLADVAADAAGNLSTAAASPLSVEYNTSVLTVDIDSGVTGPTKAAIISITVTFSETVIAFNSSDLDLANCTLASGIDPSNNPVFTFDIAPDATGDVTITILPDVVTSSTTGRGNQTNSHTFQYDITPPVPPVISDISGIYNNSQTLTVEVTAASAEYSTNNGGNWTPYTGPVTLSDEGTYQVTARQTDEAGNVSDQTSVFSVTIDTTAPVPGTLSVGSATTSDISLSWTEATDNFSDTGVLEYKLVSSSTGTVNTLNGAEAGTEEMTWTQNQLAATTVSTLDPGTQYYLNVIVIDEAGNKGLYGMVSPFTVGPIISVKNPTSAAITNGSTVIDVFVNVDPDGDSALDGSTDAISGEAVFTIENTASLAGSDLNISNVTLTGANAGDFDISTPASTSVAQGASTTLGIKFDPLGWNVSPTPDRSAIVTIEHNDPDEDPFTFTITGLANSPTLWGIVKDQDTTPVEGAYVRLYNDDESISEYDASKVDGYYAFFSIPSGTYYLVAKKDDYELFTQVVTIP